MAVPTATRRSHLQDLDYSVVQQCMHCGLCLPSCPSYDLTKLERHSPRGRISLMRAIADGDLEVTRTFAGFPGTSEKRAATPDLSASHRPEATKALLTAAGAPAGVPT